MTYVREDQEPEINYSVNYTVSKIKAVHLGSNDQNCANKMRKWH